MYGDTLDSTRTTVFSQRTSIIQNTQNTLLLFPPRLHDTVYNLQHVLTLKQSFPW